VTAVSPTAPSLLLSLATTPTGAALGLRREYSWSTRRRAPSGRPPAGWAALAEQSFVFDPKDTLDATMVDCTQKSTMRTAVLWVSPRDADSDKKGALVATAAAGDLAYQAGHIKLGGQRPPYWKKSPPAADVNGKPLAAINSAAPCPGPVGPLPPNASTTSQGERRRAKDETPGQGRDVGRGGPGGMGRRTLHLRAQVL